MRRGHAISARSRRDLGVISQEEIAEMKRKFKIMNHQIEQLKEEIHSKDQVNDPPQPTEPSAA